MASRHRMAGLLATRLSWLKSPATSPPASPIKLYRGERAAYEKPLGTGNYCPKEGKLMVLRIVDMFKTDMLKFGPAFKEKAPRGTAEQAARALCIGKTCVEQIIAEAQKTGKVADPDWSSRGQAEEPKDWVPAEALAAIRQAIHDLQHHKPPLPTSIKKIQAQIELNDVVDSLGNALDLSYGQVNRAMHLMGYRYGAAGTHHVAKESAANIAYRKHYVNLMLDNTDENGLPIRPVIVMDESYVVRTISCAVLIHSFTVRSPLRTSAALLCVLSGAVLVAACPLSVCSSHCGIRICIT